MPESFVHRELPKLSSWTDERPAFWHCCDKDGNQVDIIVEDGRGQIVGIEFKPSATVPARDFSGLRPPEAACNDRFVQGPVLFDHDRTVPFGERMDAAPISAL